MGIFMQDYNRFKADKTENRNHIATKTVEIFTLCSL